jgi:hypothetical protein
VIEGGPHTRNRTGAPKFILSPLPRVTYRRLHTHMVTHIFTGFLFIIYAILTWLMNGAHVDYFSEPAVVGGAHTHGENSEGRCLAK